jgi:hypothetical protein
MPRWIAVLIVAGTVAFTVHWYVADGSQFDVAFVSTAELVYTRQPEYLAMLGIAWLVLLVALWSVFRRKRDSE